MAISFKESADLSADGLEIARKIRRMNKHWKEEKNGRHKKMDCGTSESLGIHPL